MAFGRDINKITNNSTQSALATLANQIIPVRVLAVDNSPSLTNGEITGDVLTNQATLQDQQLISASPLFPNISYVPLVNEVVFCVQAPSSDWSSNTAKFKHYYICPVNMWGNINTNPTPSPYSRLKPTSQDKSILEVDAGSSNKSSEEDDNTFKPGTYFREKSNIYPLFPYEGDIIYEGRWGNSIRFGSTNISYNKPTTTKVVRKTYVESVNFNSGQTNAPLTLDNKLTILESRVKQFFDQYEEDKISIFIRSSESQVTPPPGVKIGELARLRSSNIKERLLNTDLLNQNITTSSEVGPTPYVRGVDDPNDPKFNKEQFTQIQVVVEGTIETQEESDPTPLNLWSVSGSTGDPILVFRNGQDPELPSPAQSQTIENVNKDLSSLYLTSTQNIPIDVSSTNDYLSYGDNPPILPKSYAGNSQVILNSGRLVFNTTKDHILLSSAKSINLNAIEGIYTDTIGDTVFQSNKVYLGGTNNSQPVILGDELVTLLTDVLNDLSTLTNTLQSQPGVPIGAPLAPTSIVAQTINFKINGYKQRLKNTLSKTTSTV